MASARQQQQQQQQLAAAQAPPSIRQTLNLPDWSTVGSGAVGNSFSRPAAADAGAADASAASCVMTSPLSPVSSADGPVSSPVSPAAAAASGAASAPRRQPPPLSAADRAYLGELQVQKGNFGAIQVKRTTHVTYDAESGTVR